MRLLVALSAAILLAGCASARPVTQDVQWNYNEEGVSVIVVPDNGRDCMTFKGGRPVPARLNAQGEWECFGVDTP